MLLSWLDGPRTALSKTYRRTTCRYRITGTGNQIIVHGASLKHVEFLIDGNDNVLTFEENCRIYRTRFEVHGSGHHVHFARNAAIKTGALIRMNGERSQLSVGVATTIESIRLALEDDSRLIIGNDCMIAYDVEIRTGDSHSLLDHATGERLNPAADVSVGDHVWISARATILKGVTIGDNSVVANGAVVSRSCGSGEVVAGVPARVVRTGVTWDRSRFPTE
jgi:acetyltransferase-like isoleucine patch superfamily enzyme